MPNFLINKLKKEYKDSPRQNSIVYGTLNKMGFMHGNKETAKGRAADRKHAIKMAIARSRQRS